jgi:hypothetical protein
MTSWNSPLSRRTLLRGATTTTAALAVGGLAVGSAGAGYAATSPCDVRVSDDGFDVHVEPHVAVNPSDPGNLLGASIVQQGDARGLATYASFDGGTSWHSNGLLPGATLAYDGDVTVAYDQHGTGYVCGLLSAAKDLVNSSVVVWRTDDGGRTFADPVPVRTGTVDHPWLVAGRSPRTPGHLHVAWVDGPRLSNGLGYSRSTDGGRSFEAPRFLDPLGRVPMTATGPRGTVHIIYQVFQSDGSFSVLVTTSTDQGDTFQPPVTLARIIPPTQAPPGFAVNAKSSPTIAAGLDGRVYATFPDYDTASGQFVLRLLVSSDRGSTWIARTLAVSADVVYLQPMVALTDGGRVGVSVFAVAQNQVDVLLFTAGRQATGFREQLVTSRPFDATLAVPSGGQYYLGDHQGLAGSREAFHPFWNDTRTGRLELFTARVV